MIFACLARVLVGGNGLLRGAHAADLTAGATEQEAQQRLLRVQPVLRLVPDDGSAGPSITAGGDLLTAVGGQAVQHDRVGAAVAISCRRHLERHGTAPALGGLASSWPIDTQVSVATTSAPVTASAGSCRTWTEPPVAEAIAAASATTAASGR